MDRIPLRSLLTPPMLAACLMIAFQMAGKAIRDSFFLSHFPVTRLPAMVVGAALLALVVAFAFSLLLRRFGPARLTPLSFLASALLLLLEWSFVDSHPTRVAILFYLHFAALGSSLVSLFWALVNEAYDPHRAKREVARIGSAAAAGGVLGALLAERLAAWSVDSLGFVALAVIHLGCALASSRMRLQGGPPRQIPGESWSQGFRAARSHSLLRGVVFLGIGESPGGRSYRLRFQG